MHVSDKLASEMRALKTKQTKYSLCYTRLAGRRFLDGVREESERKQKWVKDGRYQGRKGHASGKGISQEKCNSLMQSE